MEADRRIENAFSPTIIKLIGIFLNLLKYSQQIWNETGESGKSTFDAN